MNDKIRYSNNGQWKFATPAPLRKTQLESGIFTDDLIKELEAVEDILEAKTRAYDAIDEANDSDEDKAKVHKLINECDSKEALVSIAKKHMREHRAPELKKGMDTKTDKPIYENAHPKSTPEEAFEHHHKKMLEAGEKLSEDPRLHIKDPKKYGDLVGEYAHHEKERNRHGDRALELKKSEGPNEKPKGSYFDLFEKIGDMDEMPSPSSGAEPMVQSEPTRKDESSTPHDEYFKLFEHKDKHMSDLSKDEKTEVMRHLMALKAKRKKADK